MIRVKFSETVNGEEIQIVAAAKDVDSYGAVGLKLKFINSEGEIVPLAYNKKIFDGIEEKATDLLYERKYAKELEF